MEPPEPIPSLPGLSLFFPAEPLPFLALRQGRVALCNEAAERLWRVLPGGLDGVPLASLQEGAPQAPPEVPSWRRLRLRGTSTPASEAYHFSLPDPMGTQGLLLVDRSCCPPASLLPQGDPASLPLLDLVEDLLFLLEPDGTVLGANRAACRRMGVSRQELRGRRFHDLLNPPDQPHGTTLHLQALLEGSAPAAAALVTREGMPFPVRLRLFSGFWGGCPVLFLGGRDFSTPLGDEPPGHRRRRQRTLRALLGAFPEPAYFLDLQGLFRDCNDAFEDLTGLSREQMVGHRIAELPLGPLCAVPPSRDREGIPLEFPSPEGSRFLLLRTSPCQDGREEGTLGILFDVTDRKEAEAALEGARQVAERADQAKSAFLAQVSHEIRNPLGTLLGLAELCLGTSLQPRQRHWVEGIHQSATHLLRIANDILDLSRVEAGKLELERVPFCPSRLLREALRSVSPQGETKGLVLALREGELPPRLLGDPGRILQILGNLLVNAVKFSDWGQVTLAARMGDEGTLEVEVSDTGRGIDEEDLGKVFQPFWQAQTSAAAQGMGLGLPIARQLARTMGGDLDVRSRRGEGATFRVRLPLPQAPADLPLPETPSETPVPPTPSLRVLLAEDSPMNRELIQTVLASWGHRVVPVASGNQALALLDREDFDAAILDIQMPDGDGLSTARTLRERERGTGRRLPLVALTAYAMEEDRIRCLEAGMDHYLSKPVSLRALRETLRDLGGPAPAPSEPPAPEAPMPDLAPLRDLTGNREDLMKRAVQLFFQGTPLMLENLRVALLRDNPRGVEAAAHRLKGGLAHLGDPEATRLAEEIHRLHHAPQEVLLPLLESLTSRMDQLQTHFCRKGWLEEGGS